MRDETSPLAYTTSRGGKFDFSAIVPAYSAFDFSDYSGNSRWADRHSAKRIYPYGDCPDFRVNENGTVPFRLDFDDFDRPDTKILTSPLRRDGCQAIPRSSPHARSFSLRAERNSKTAGQSRLRLLSIKGHFRGDCPDFRVNENGTVPFRLRADQHRQIPEFHALDLLFHPNCHILSRK